MYEVVSRGVIRAALRWMNMPAVTLELCQNFTFPNGLHTCAYRARFDGDLAEKRVRQEWRATGKQEFGFDILLEECFGRDITVLPDYSWTQFGEVSYILVCRLYPREQMTGYSRNSEPDRNANGAHTIGFYSPDEQTVMSDIPF